MPTRYSYPRARPPFSGKTTTPPTSSIMKSNAKSQSESPEKVARARIDEARRTGANQLSLSGLELSAVPPEVWELMSLRTLWLNQNSSSDLSPEVGQLLHLRHLGLGQNQLKSLPSQVGKLEELERLGLERNAITNLPPELSNLRNLRTLILSGNPFGKLPDGIVEFPELEILGISRLGDCRRGQGRGALVAARNANGRLPGPTGHGQNGVGVGHESVSAGGWEDSGDHGEHGSAGPVATVGLAARAGQDGEVKGRWQN